MLFVRSGRSVVVYVPVVVVAFVDDVELRDELPLFIVPFVIVALPFDIVLFVLFTAFVLSVVTGDTFVEFVVDELGLVVVWALAIPMLHRHIARSEN